ncbi:MAG: ABC transporter ATP-binding protein [Microbacterium sp.]
MAESLVVDGLRIAADSGRVLVDDVSFTAAPGEVLALVGESGSGKTTVALSLLGYTQRGVRWVSGQVRIGDTLVWDRPEPRRRALRGRKISYVPQDPATQLNPAHTIGRQLHEAIERTSEAATDVRKLELLANVGLPAETRILRSYPFELSGGQQQRVAIAMALAVRPAVIVLDEPTTGLDVTTQQRILHLLRDLADSGESAFIYITHDLGAVRQLADRVMVMRSGTLIESGDTDDVLAEPQHPYTRLLVASAPSREGIRLYRGSESVDEAQLLRPPPDAPQHAPLLQARDIEVTYGKRGRKSGTVVLQSFDLEVAEGETLALVGESGSGKSTFVRAACGLAPVTAGEFLLGGRALPRHVRNRDLEQLRSIQMVYQNPDRSLNPSETVWDSIARSVRSLRRGTSRDEQNRLINDALDRVHLSRAHAGKYPDELSGGEKQRASIARALVGLPRVLVCDEVTSALDASTQAVIISLLGELNAQGLTVLYVTHDLGAVRSVAHRIAVLRKGRICELGATDGVLDHPEHEYTRELLAATAFIR